MGDEAWLLQNSYTKLPLTLEADPFDFFSHHLIIDQRRFGKECKFGVFDKPLC